MAEPGLALSHDDLRDHIVEFLYGGTGDYDTPSTSTGAYSDTEKKFTDRVLQSGLRQFYLPPPVQGRRHDWSFLKVEGSLDLQAPYTGGYVSFDSDQNLITLCDGMITKVTKTNPVQITVNQKLPSDFDNGAAVTVQVHDVTSASNGVADLVNRQKSCTKVSDYVFQMTGINTSGAADDYDGGGSYRIVANTTLPSWTKDAQIRIDNTDYRVTKFIDEGEYPTGHANVGVTQTNYRAYLQESAPSSSFGLPTDFDDSDDEYDTAGTLKSYSLHKDTYELPATFSRVVGDITFTQTDNAWYTVKQIGEARIRELRQRNFHTNYSNTGDPQFFAVREAAHDFTTVGRKEIMFWPNITATATALYQYRVRTDWSANTHKASYPPGAADHSETILMSCLAQAELERDGERGQMHQRYMEALASSIATDSYDNKPTLFGYNSDSSDGANLFETRRRYLFGDGVTYKGTGSS